ncbi:MAG: site-specific integrase [Planctomycetota bacterium]|nr:site-specific integrase [Planctomycetota bacterium]
MPRLIHQNPKYRRHRASGQAIVTIDGRDFYLGPYGTRASRDEYDRFIGEWLASGRRLPGKGLADVYVAEILAAFMRHATTYYRKPDGTPTSEIDSYRQAIGPMKRLYGRIFAADFGPLALKAVREEMVRLGLCRNTINRHMGRIKHIFKWAASNELAPAAIHEALRTVEGLKAGRSEAKESVPVQPVPEEHVDAAVRFMSRQVAAMVKLQLVTGMRSGEVCAMRTCDIDTAGRLWQYKPTTHKTQHHGHERVIYMGPKAKEIVKPFLKADLIAFVFSPAEAEAERRAEMHRKRKTPLSCGNVPGSNVKRAPRRRPGDRYTATSYGRAVKYACDRADELAKGGVAIADDERIIPRWHPHQLRHTAGTRLRKEFGVEAAQVVLGHKSLSVTELYAEKNIQAAQRIAAEVG